MFIIAGLLLILAAVVIQDATAQSSFNGLSMGMGNLSRLSKAKTRSISPENFTGEKGKAGMATEGTGARAARDLGRGWKISPSVRIKAGETFTVAEINGSGAIQHIWMTPTGMWRHLILRMYWDGEESPSVEVPVGDFFGTGFMYKPYATPYVGMSSGGYYSYFPMPFNRTARIEIVNETGRQISAFYYHIDYQKLNEPLEKGPSSSVLDERLDHARWVRWLPRRTSSWPRRCKEGRVWTRRTERTMWTGEQES